MSILDDLASEMNRHRQRLFNTYTPTALTPTTSRMVPSFEKEQIEAMLRIEVTPEAFHDIVQAWHNPHRDKPITFMAASVYVVDHKLPECGWRVINPMSAA